MRKLEDETGVKDVFLEQLYTFSDLDGRESIAVAYFALVDVCADAPRDAQGVVARVVPDR